MTVLAFLSDLSRFGVFACASLSVLSLCFMALSYALELTIKGSTSESHQLFAEATVWFGLSGLGFGALYFLSKIVSA